MGMFTRFVYGITINLLTMQIDNMVRYNVSDIIYGFFEQYNSMGILNRHTYNIHLRHYKCYTTANFILEEYKD